MADLRPPFTLATAHRKVKAAQALWNTRTPSKVVAAYTPDSIWRNRSTFLRGHDQIEAFLTAKWKREQDYRLRKELFAFESLPSSSSSSSSSSRGEGAEGRFGAPAGEGELVTGNKIAVQFWYEYRDAEDGMAWKRCYGIEHWTFDAQGKMRKRMMSGNDVIIGEEGRWFRDGLDVDEVPLGEEHF